MASNITTFRKALKLTSQGPKEVNEQVDLFTYSFRVANLAAAGQSVQTINIQADSDFVVTKMTYMADLAGAAVTFNTFVIPLVRVLITDQGSGRNLMDGAVDISSIAGNAFMPAIPPVNRRFSANSTITATFTNYSAATTYTNLHLYLHGYKAWELSR